jgi:hypothetical protein
VSAILARFLAVNDSQKQFTKKKKKKENEKKTRKGDHL